MPELPELEHFKRYFNRTSLRRKIDRISCKNTKLLEGGSVAAINKKIAGKSFKCAYRRGKFLIAPLSDDNANLVFHFGLTGFLRYKKAKEPREKDYAKVVIIFRNGDELRWINKRNFGRVYFVKDISQIKTIKTMGPEASTITSKNFKKLLDEHVDATVKTFLMDQKNIAGIGNDYSNEILFQASIIPTAHIDDLTNGQVRRLYTVMKRILRQASRLKIMEREEHFPRTWLLAHKQDMICPKNKNHKLKKRKIGGRSAYFCSEHQRK